MVASLLRSRELGKAAAPGLLPFRPRADGEEVDDCVELYNLMIIGAHFLQADFLKLPEMKNALQIISMKSPTYFSYITVKFCFLKDQAEYSANLLALNQSVRTMILGRIDELERDAELYLLCCDYLSAPDISAVDKRTLFVKLFGGAPSNAAAVSAGRYLGFVDWTGVHINHVLARKRLRPVYSWS
jgi:hypothetical protein